MKLKGLRKILACLTICGCVVSNQYVVKADEQKNTCECNGVQYASINEAVDAAEENKEAKITMIADENISECIEIRGSRVITLDLAGHKINSEASSDNSSVWVYEDSTFTLNDSVGNGTITTDKMFGIGINEGQFIMNGGNFINESDDMNIGILCAKGKVTVNGGTISAYAPLEIDIFGGDSNEIEATINGGKFCAKKYSYINGNSKVTITGGDFSSEGDSALNIGFINSDPNVSNVSNVIMRGGEYHGQIYGILLGYTKGADNKEFSFSDVLYKDCVLSDETTTNGTDVSGTNVVGSAKDVKVLTKLNQDNAKIDDIKDQDYTGNAITPEIQVSYDGNKLVNGQDYDVVYKDNVNAGTATATINFKGNYTGSVSKTFTIVGTPNTTNPTDPTEPINNSDNNGSKNNIIANNTNANNAKTSVKTGDSFNAFLIIGFVVSGLFIVACSKKRQGKMN